MGCKPTLGGLKKAQEFLRLRGYPMPILKVNVRRCALISESWDVKGMGISLDDAIRKYGPMREVVNVALISECGKRLLLFVSNKRLPFSYTWRPMARGWSTTLFYSRGNPQFADFITSKEDGKIFVNLVRWGKPEVTIHDRAKFRFSPERYAIDVFS